MRIFGSEMAKPSHLIDEIANNNLQTISFKLLLAPEMCAE
jgi:hypothetical protein